MSYELIQPDIPKGKMHEDPPSLRAVMEHIMQGTQLQNYVENALKQKENIKKQINENLRLFLPVEYLIKLLMEKALKPNFKQNA